MARGEHFQSSSRSYSEKFQEVKMNKENNAYFKSTNVEECNFNSKFDELIEAIKKSYDSATGLDEIHQLLNLHAIDKLIGIWTAGVFYLIADGRLMHADIVKPM